jgi:hypothetical protein
MSKLNLNRQVFDKNKFKNTVDTSFSQLKEPATTQAIPSLGNVNEFFTLYSELFFQIPKFGPTNSHEFLVKESGNYINVQQNNEEIQALLQEITSLREENLQLLQTNIDLTTQIALSLNG